jgi:hypothetical protein
VLVRLLGFFIILVLIGGMAEVGSYVVVSYLSHAPQTRLLLYRPPSIAAAEYDDYLRRRDPRLGWPPPEQIGGTFYDRSGSRRVPAFPDPGGECATVYGDSFTYASDVSDEEAWPNLLSGRLRCRIGNFGVGGYGTDQAYLRFEYNSADRAPVTLLGIHPTDAMRNLTRNGYLAFGAYPTSFKPRFVHKGDKLTLLPLPTVALDQLDEFAQHPGRFLRDDMLIPGSRFGPVPAEFPFSLTLLRVVSRPSVHNWLLGRPSWFNFYQPGDDSTGLEVIEGIIGKFVTLCTDRHKQCAVLLFPSPNSYAYYQKTGQSPLESLTRDLKRRGVRYLDLTPGFAKALAGKQFCDLVDGPESCAGHFNAQGNKLVAALVHEFLMQSPDVHIPQSNATSLAR